MPTDHAAAARFTVSLLPAPVGLVRGTDVVSTLHVGGDVVTLYAIRVGDVVQTGTKRRPSSYFRPARSGYPIGFGVRTERLFDAAGARVVAETSVDGDEFGRAGCGALTEERFRRLCAKLIRRHAGIRPAYRGNESLRPAGA